MRIAHVVSTFPPYKGGMGNVAQEIAERTAKRGDEVMVVTPGMWNVKCEMVKIKDYYLEHSTFNIQHFIPSLRFGNAAWSPTIDGILERARVDLVHLHWPFIGGAGAVFAWRRRNPHRRLVVQYHMNLLAPGWRGVMFAMYERWAIPRMVRAADRIVVSSLDYTRQGTLAPYTEKLEGRIVGIPLGVDTERFFPNPQRPARGTQLHVIFVGGLDHAHVFKGVPTLLNAIARVPNARLEVVGDGDLRPTYEQQARILGITDRVTFLGSVSNTELPLVHQRADVLVLPSTARSEAFGLVLLEAMASGVATIASNLPGVRTVIVEGETGFLVSPGDVNVLAECIERFVRDPSLARRMGAAGRHRAETAYAWDGIIEQWNGLYVSCASF